MKKFNIALAIEVGEIFTADFISMTILIICICFPIIFMVWLGIHNYRETGNVFQQTVETNSIEPKLSPEKIAEVRTMSLDIIKMEIKHLELVNCDSFGKDQLQKNEYYHALKKQEAFLTGKVIRKKKSCQDVIEQAKNRMNTSDPFQADLSPDPTLNNK